MVAKKKVGKVFLEQMLLSLVFINLWRQRMVNKLLHTYLSRYLGM